MNNDPFSRVNYKKNFLKSVILRVDLLSPLPGLNEALPQPLSDVAVETFPIPEPTDTVARNVEIGPAGVKSQEERFKEWRFHGKERNKTLTITREAVYVEYKRYQAYEFVKAEFVRILDRVGNLFQGAASKRVGLRYINSIEPNEPNPTDWTPYIVPGLLSLFQFPRKEDRLALSRVFHNIEFSFDAFNLRYQFGMHNPDYPARIRQKIFILDFDAYASSVLDIREIPHVLDEFHAIIQRYFEESITDELRRIMNAG